MKIKPKGRKIYRYQTRNERLKGFFRNKGAVIFTVLGIAVVGFVGYSVADPVLKFLEEQKLITSENSGASSVQDPSSIENSEGTSKQAEETDPQTETETEASTRKPIQIKDCHMYLLNASAVKTAAALEEALTSLPEGITHVVVPLKTKGGSLRYATTLQDARVSGAAASAMELAEICNIIQEAGYTPSASLNAFEDHLYPQTHMQAGFLIEGTDTLWTDSEAGKPWLSPFSTLAVEYLSAVTAEVAEAGFSPIICDGLAFPTFKKEDLMQLDSRAGAYERGQHLAYAVRIMQGAAGDTPFLVSVEAEKLLKGAEEVLLFEEKLTADAVLVSMTAQSLAQQEQVKAKLGDLTYVFALEEGTDQPDAYVENGNFAVYSTAEEPVEEETEETEQTTSAPETTEASKPTAAPTQAQATSPPATDAPTEASDPTEPPTEAPEPTEAESSEEPSET